MNIPGIFDPNCNSADAHNGFSTWKDHMDVSENNGTSKSSIFIGFSIINHPFWGIYPYFWKHPHHSSHFSLPFVSIWPFSEVVASMALPTAVVLLSIKVMAVFMPPSGQVKGSRCVLGFIN